MIKAMCIAVMFGASYRAPPPPPSIHPIVPILIVLAASKSGKHQETKPEPSSQPASQPARGCR